jgi:hypothetical protein
MKRTMTTLGALMAMAAPAIAAGATEPAHYTAHRSRWTDCRQPTDPRYNPLTRYCKRAVRAWRNKDRTSCGS